MQAGHPGADPDRADAFIGTIVFIITINFPLDGGWRYSQRGPIVGLPVSSSHEVTS
jgi:hypothetical protein